MRNVPYSPGMNAYNKMEEAATEALAVQSVNTKKIVVQRNYRKTREGKGKSLRNMVFHK